jgi:hypothetical protein
MAVIIILGYHCLDSFRRKVLYNILIEFGVSMKLVMLIKMYLYLNVGKYFSDSFPIKNGLKQ